jgi:RNA polymerase sigma factor (sigma-70 family)
MEGAVTSVASRNITSRATLPWRYGRLRFRSWRCVTEHAQPNDDVSMTQSAESDESLVERCRRGDAAAWEALVRRYQRLVYAIARRAGLDAHDAADVFQTVFMRLFQHLSRIAEPARLQAWIVTTAKRETLLQRRRAGRTVSIGGSEGADDGFDASMPVDEAPRPDESVEQWQMLAQVDVALERLDERCRQLLRLLFGDGEAGYDEASTKLGMPVGSIGPTRARCLDKLRRLVD